jgi:predicted nucleic acid-binding protein
VSLVFFDTNILVYTDDASSRKKQDVERSLVAERQRSGSLVVSLQVLQEYFVAATRKLNVDADIAQRKIELLGQGHVVRFDADDVIASIELHRLSRLSFWDAMIVHAARISACSKLFSEDLQYERTIAGVKIINPFA